MPTERMILASSRGEGLVNSTLSASNLSKS
jgi:hypothetical protein